MKNLFTASMLLLPLAWSAGVAAEGYTVRGYEETFGPTIVYMQPGDTVRWVNMITHNTVSQEGLIPDGAEGWYSWLDEDFEITLDIEGVYAYVCEPHLHVGMVGLVVVGEPVNIDEAVKYARENLKGGARHILDLLLQVQEKANTD